MKKTNIKRILSLVLVCVALIGAAVGFSASAESAQTVSIVSNNVFYGDTLQLMYAVDAPVLNDGDELRLTIYTDEACTQKFCDGYEGGTVTLSGETYKKFYSTKGVPAQDINTPLYAKAEIVNGGNVVASDVQRYSVLEYLNERLYVSTNTKDYQRDMYNALIAFAKTAEITIYDNNAANAAKRVSRPINEYYYVSLTGAAFAEGGSVGMYKTEDLAGLVATVEAGENQEIEWYIGGVKTTLDAIKAMTLTGATFIEARVVDVDAPYVPVYNWTLVTDVSVLKAGQQIIIAAADADVAMCSTQETNNRKTDSITKGDNVLTSVGANVQIITLEAGETLGTFAFNVGGGYLYAASSTSNHLKTENELTGNSSWTINVTDKGIATVTAQGENTKNLLRYNSSSKLFSCYSTGQQDICIYYRDVCEHTYGDAVVVNPTCAEAGSSTKTCSTCGHTEVEVLEATGLHTEATLPGTPASCTATGLTDGVECSVCHTVLTAQVEIPVVDHFDGDDADTICDTCDKDMAVAPTDDEIVDKILGSIDNPFDGIETPVAEDSDVELGTDKLGYDAAEIVWSIATNNGASGIDGGNLLKIVLGDTAGQLSVTVTVTYNEVSDSKTFGPIDVNAKAPEVETEPAYVKVTSEAEFTSGQYVLVVDGGYAPTKLDGTWILADKPTIDGDTITTTNATNFAWTLTVDGSSVKMKDTSGKFIAPPVGNTNSIQSKEYAWAWTFNNGTFTFKGTGSDTTTLAANKSSAYKLRAYKNATVSGSPSSYPSAFTLYKLVE